MMNATNLTSALEEPAGPATSTAMKDIASFMLYVGYVVVPAFLVLGVCGNIVTIIVMKTKAFRHLSTSYVLIALALSDTCLNIMVPFNKGFVRELLGTDIRSYSDLGCNLFFWAWRTSKMTSSWLVVLICAERLVAVCMPMRASIINSKKNVLVAIVMIYIVIGGYVILWSSVSDRRLAGICRPNTQPPGWEYASTILMYIGVSLYALLPSALLICGTVITIIGLHMARRRRRHLSVSARGNIARDPTAKTTAMLLSVSIAFIMLVLPIGLAHLFSFIQGQSIFESTNVGFVIYREVAQFLEQLNYSINFLLYVTASKGFRDRILIAFCRREQNSGWTGSSNQSFSKRSFGKANSEATLSRCDSMKSTGHKAAADEGDAEVRPEEREQDAKDQRY